jgi:hypothetical protein
MAWAPMPPDAPRSMSKEDHVEAEIPTPVEIKVLDPFIQLKVTGTVYKAMDRSVSNKDFRVPHHLIKILLTTSLSYVLHY